MGTYINKGNEGFRRALNGDYVDKTGMIAEINKTLDTERAFTCVTRCRRFGKTLAAKMLCAYYDRSCDSRSLFDGLNISLPDEEGENKQYEKHLNKYPVISLDITSFTTRYTNDDAIVKYLQNEVKEDVLKSYPDVKVKDSADLMEALLEVAMQTGDRFIMLIDEWDAILRENEKKPELVDEYVDLLRRLFKGDDSSRVFAGVYMTGILPIKKYKTQSALNNFREYSMVQPGRLESYFGFTPSEVAKLVEEQNDVAIEDLKKWYDGYSIGKEPSLYNPYSVIEALANGECDNYWANTGAFDNVSDCISMNFKGLKDDVIYMLSGGRCDVDTTGFQNDPAIIRSKDDALTILIHLGYLAYEKKTKQCYIPNKEVSEEMEKAVKACNWEHLNEALYASKSLLAATLSGDEEAVARGIELAHDEDTSILSYNDENSLACVLSIAYYYAKNDYIIHRELPTGKGFADLVLIPRRNVDSPALVLELKYNKDADAAIDQIKRKNYPEKVAEYTGDILLVGINYDKNGPEGKKHSCKIEQHVK